MKVTTYTTTNPDQVRTLLKKRPANGFVLQLVCFKVLSGIDALNGDFIAFTGGGRSGVLLRALFQAFE